MCKHFICSWLAGFGGEEWRPDRCGLILTNGAVDDVFPKNEQFAEMYHKRPDDRIITIREVREGALFAKSARRIKSLCEQNYNSLPMPVTVHPCGTKLKNNPVRMYKNVVVLLLNENDTSFAEAVNRWWEST